MQSETENPGHAARYAAAVDYLNVLNAKLGRKTTAEEKAILWQSTKKYTIEQLVDQADRIRKEDK